MQEQQEVKTDMVAAMKDTKELGGLPVAILEKAVTKEEWLELFNTYPVIVSEETNSLHFMMEETPKRDILLGCMFPDFVYYIKTKTESECGTWDNDALIRHCKKCVNEVSQDWKDFVDKFGNDYNPFNGCRSETLLYAALKILSGDLTLRRSRNGSIAKTKIEEAIMWLEKNNKERKYDLLYFLYIEEEEEPDQPVLQEKLEQQPMAVEPAEER